MLMRGIMLRKSEGRAATALSQVTGRAALALGLAAAASVLSLGGHSPAMAADTSGVLLNAPAEVAPDGDFTVTVEIGDVSAFDAGQFDVTFDQSMFRLDDVTAGQIGSTGIPVGLWNEMSAGTCRVIVNVPGVPGVSGSGSLAVLHFHASGSAAGSSPLALSNGFLNSNTGEEIAATWAGGSITVGDNPEPADETPGSPDSQGSPDGQGPHDGQDSADGTAQKPVFRWWVLGLIVGTAVVLIAATAAGLLLRRRQMAGSVRESAGSPRQPRDS